MSLAFSFLSLDSLAQGDIRVADSASLSGADAVTYTAQIQNCSSLVSLSVGSGSRFDAVSPSLWESNGVGSDGCSYSFELSGSERLLPSVKGQRQNSVDFSINEEFKSETHSPTIDFSSVAIEGADGAQQLIVTVEASDDTDVAYIGFNVLGIRASDLTTSGGV